MSPGNNKNDSRGSGGQLPADTLAAPADPKAENGTCRLCAHHRLGYDMLLKEHSELRTIVKKYLFLQFIDGLPTHICLVCASLMNTWEGFMKVFKKSQEQFMGILGFKTESENCTQMPSNIPSDPLLKMPSPVKTPTSTPVPDNNKKRKADHLDFMLSPSTSSSSIQASPESGKLLICNDQDGNNGSETDDASECPAEVVKERTNVRAKRYTPRSKKQAHVWQKPILPLPVQPQMIQNQLQQGLHQHQNMGPNPFGLSQQQLLILQHQQHLAALVGTNLQKMQHRSAPPYMPMFQNPPPPFGNQGQRFPASQSQSEEALVLQGFLNTIPTYMHQNFLIHYYNNLVMMDNNKKQPVFDANGAAQPPHGHLQNPVNYSNGFNK